VYETSQLTFLIYLLNFYSVIFLISSALYGILSNHMCDAILYKTDGLAFIVYLPDWYSLELFPVIMPVGRQSYYWW